MKKLIVIIAAVSFITLGFSVVDKPHRKVLVKEQISGKIDFSDKLNEKRLASWD